MAATLELEIVWDFLINRLKHRVGYYRWLCRFNAVIRKHQIFEKNHRQRKWYINASIRG